MQSKILMLLDCYTPNGVSLPVAIETLHQKVAALSRKIARFTARVEGLHQNKLFASDQRKFYKQLTSDGVVTDKSPYSDAIIKFWSMLWGDTAPHNRDAVWIKSTELNLHNLCAKETLVITPRLVAAAVKRLSNWKAPGPDCIHNFSVKYLSSLHDRLSAQIQNVVNGEVPEWLTLGRIVLILKNNCIRAEVVTNYCTITCLSNIWKLITSVVSKAIVHRLNINYVWPWEQKSCKPRSRPSFS